MVSIPQQKRLSVTVVSEALGGGGGVVGEGRGEMSDPLNAMYKLMLL